MEKLTGMELSEVIRDTIKKKGPISFRDFMDMALYYPSYGYYNRQEDKIGKEGDFYTSPVLTTLFGEMIGKQLLEMWVLLGKKPFTIIEYGAGTGALAQDILHFLQEHPEMYKHLRYCIIEKGEKMRLLQKELLTGKVHWLDSISEISGINGCVLSNELLDNFPVHKAVMKDELMEFFVDYTDGFVEILKPASADLKDYFEELQVTLPPDFVAEINLDAIQWIKEIADNLESGFVLTIDYGFLSEELYSEKRNSGTLLCYKNHRINSDPYSNIGSQDITAHVNFSALVHWGKMYGLFPNGFTTQDHFLRSLGLMNYLRKVEIENKENGRALIFQINKLMMDMGNKFKVLIQQKSEKPLMLSGMQFSSKI